jgi:hypothetical protein
MCSNREQLSVDKLSAVAYSCDSMERVMSRSAVSRSTILVAGFVALVYASLAVMAASCALRHVDPSSGHAHHGSGEATSHDALCAWACQATPDAGPVTESPALSMGQVVQLVVSSPHQEVPSLVSSLLRSRAPPSGPFVLIG